MVPLHIPLLFAVLLAGLFCLLPLSVYLLRLAQVTRRDHPTVVPGEWDFAGLLLALSGFLVAGGGLLLTLLPTNFRFWMRGNMEQFREAWVQERVTWGLLVAAYLIAVGGIATLTFLARRRSLVIYNVEPAAFEHAVREVFDQLGRPLERRGKQWLSGAPLFEADEFEAGHTVTLRWVSADGRLFDEVARQLRAALATHSSGENPASRWLMSVATGAGILAVCSFGLFMFGMSQMR